MHNLIRQTKELDYESAVQMCLTAISQARVFSASIGVVVLSPTGIELAMVRMNNAPLHAFNIARKKAYTAASFKVPTYSWQETLKQKPTTLNALLQEDNFTYLGGGIPIFSEKEGKGELLGAIGVSGATEQQDIACAEHAINQLLHAL
jgi:uncharacterized protein GlcG (DUF336 family)